MEIAEIKARLPLASVLARYGLAPDASGRMRCPFHDDRSPSFHVYADAWHCFALRPLIEAVWMNDAGDADIRLPNLALRRIRCEAEDGVQVFLSHILPVGLSALPSSRGSEA
jgi:hypothetical protein